MQKSHFFRYLQLRHYIRSHLSGFETAEPDKLDNHLRSCLGTEHIIAYLYDAIQNKCHTTMDNIKKEWEKELGTEIEEVIWNEALEYVNSCSINARHCLIQFKILHRLHYSKVRIHKIFPEVSPMCEKCKSSEANLLHSYALCPRIQEYWKQIFEVLSKVLKVQIIPDPILIIFGTSARSNKFQATQQQLLTYGILNGKKLILMFWKKEETPSLRQWLAALMDTLHLERIRYVIKDRLKEFEKIWQPLLLYLEETDS